VPADVAIRLEHGDVEAAVQEMSTAEAGNAGSNDGETRARHAGRKTSATSLLRALWIHLLFGTEGATR
jgi:hypothetical protein